MTVPRLGPNLVLVMSLISIGGARQRSETIQPITDAKAVLALYTEDLGLLSMGASHRLIVVAWDDGRIVWSDDSLNGGPPYRQARIDGSRVASMLARLDADGLFDIPDLANARFGPDAKFSTIMVKFGGKQVEMRSWHELTEERGGIAKKTGLVAGDRPRFQVLREEPQDYLFYRFVWAELRERLSSLVPTGGEPVDGEVMVESRVLSWRETTAR